MDGDSDAARRERAVTPERRALAARGAQRSSGAVSEQGILGSSLPSYSDGLRSACCNGCIGCTAHLFYRLYSTPHLFYKAGTGGGSPRRHRRRLSAAAPAAALRGGGGGGARGRRRIARARAAGGRVAPRVGQRAQVLRASDRTDSGWVADYPRRGRKKPASRKC